MVVFPAFARTPFAARTWTCSCWYSSQHLMGLMGGERLTLTIAVKVSMAYWSAYSYPGTLLVTLARSSVK